MLIDLFSLIEKYELDVTGILHVGVDFKLDQLDMYKSSAIDIKDIYWVQEKKNAAVDPYIDSDLTLLNYSIDELDQFEGDGKKTKRLDTLVEELDIPIEKINFLNIDIQGKELSALKSLGKYIQNIQFISTKINTEHMHKDCTLVTELDFYLRKHDFIRVETNMHEYCRCGDALYMKANLLKKKFASVKVCDDITYTFPLCFDVGANIGSWTIANAHIFNQIIAVEPSPTTFLRLNQHISNYPRIYSVNIAISSKDGIIDFYEAQNDVLSTTNKDWMIDPNNRFYGHSYTTIQVETLTLDGLINQYGHADLIKIDTGGGEYDIIQSLTRKVNHLTFAWASENTETVLACLEYLRNLGFHDFYIQLGHNNIFVPNPREYEHLESIKMKLSNTTFKKDYGTIWCK